MPEDSTPVEAGGRGLYIGFYAPPAVKAALLAEAAERGQSLSGYLREACLGASREAAQWRAKAEHLQALVEAKDVALKQLEGALDHYGRMLAAGR